MSLRERIDDELLVLRCQEGSVAAFERLVARWQERLWRHGWRLTGSEEAAWDVLQETWVAVVRGLRRLEDPAAFRSWVYQIVNHKARDWVRREQRQRRATEAYSERVENPAEGGSAADRRCENLREALGLLPGADRAILALRYDEQFDTAEIAEIMGIPAGTVKSRLYHARQRLRRLLEEPDDE
jgi:RNA polymerase sigma factor (sigma-70 family)